MLSVFVLAISALFQFLAAISAFRLIEVTGKSKSWICISIGLCLMGLRRLIPIYNWFFSPGIFVPNLEYEIVGLVLSVFMFFGVHWISPLFIERKRAEEKICSLNEELEQKIIERTSELQFLNGQLEREIEERKQAEKELMRSMAELSVLYRINSAIAESLNMDRTLKNCLESTLETLNIEAGGIYLMEQDGESLVLCAHRGHSEEFVKTIEHLKTGEGISGKAVAERRPIILAISDYPTERLAPLLIGEGLKTMASIPLVSAGKVVGALNIGTVRARAFPSDELDMLSAIGQQLGNAVQNARLYEAVQKELTERRRAEEALQQRTLQLEMINKELEAFSYSVSHDLRAPLRAIDGFSQVLLESNSGLFDDDALRYFNIIRNNTQFMGKLIDDLLSFSRIGKKEMHFSQINMERLPVEVFERIKSGYSGRDVEFKIMSPFEAYGDINMINIVLTNLISNAFKFTEKNNSTVIEFGGSEEKNENIYYVRDNGAGFDMKYVNKLFGVFQRLHSKDEFEGTGVGLALVQRIIHRHGGRVWAEAKVNEGATLYFTLPKGGSV
ncbi:MAG: ATP-binding protein [Spirochaetota bacterium]